MVIFLPLAYFHPRTRLSYFEQSDLWSDPELPQCARTDLNMMYTMYSKAVLSSATEKKATMIKETASVCSLLSAAVGTAHSQEKASKLELYLNGAYLCKNKDRALDWWKVSSEL